MNTAMMHGEDDVDYIENENAKGIIKNYKLEWSKTSETTVGSIHVSEGEERPVEYEEEIRILFIQHYTFKGKDQILFSTNSSQPAVVTFDEILAVRDALSK